MLPLRPTQSIKEANIHPKIKYVKPIGITAHSRLGCKDDASSHRHRFMFISFNLSFYITHYKIPIKTSVKYSVQPVRLRLVYFPYTSQLCSYPVTKSLSLSVSLSAKYNSI